MSINAIVGWPREQCRVKIICINLTEAKVVTINKAVITATVAAIQ